jgi:hypothetical protein
LPDRLVVVGWRSPITGLVQVGGGVTDRDAKCGDGIDWSVDLDAATLSSGAIPNGGAETFTAGLGGDKIAQVPVRVGDFLYFVVGPGPYRDYVCDSTLLDATIIDVTHRTTPATSAAPRPAANAAGWNNVR